MSHRHTITRLYASPALKVSEFACVCFGPHHGGEEAARGHEVVLPQKGYFEKRSAFGRTQGDPTRALYFKANEAYEIGHPLGGGDVSTIFEIGPETLADFCPGPWARERVLEGRPFGAGGRGIGHDLAFQHFLLLRAAKTGVDPLAFEEAALSLLARIFAAGQGAEEPSSGKTGRAAEAQRALTERAVRYLNRHFTENLTLSRLAREVASSPYHLCRIFRREAGMTIHGYLSALRLRAALDALGKKDQPLTPLALDLGYSSHSHFSAAFGRAFNLSPREARRALAVP